MLKPTHALFAFAACAAVAAMSGCSAKNDDDRVQGKMFYRASPKPARESNTMSVGRYGRNSEYGRWTERGSGSSGMGYETSSSVGRYGTTAESAPWVHDASIGGNAIDNGNVSGTYYDRGGSSLGVSGDGASSSEYGEGSSRYGSESP